MPVTLFISANATMTLAPAGALFNMPAGSAPGNPNGSFLVSVNSSSPVSCSAAVPLPGAIAGLCSERRAEALPPRSRERCSYSIDPAAAGALAPGAYYGEIEITSPEASNSPQNFEVVLNVSAANSSGGSRSGAGRSAVHHHRGRRAAAANRDRLFRFCVAIDIPGAARRQRWRRMAVGHAGLRAARRRTRRASPWSVSTRPG